MRPRIDPLVILGAVLFALAAALGVVQGVAGGDRAATGSVYDELPGGTSVLRRFLDASGIRTLTLEEDRFATRGDVVLLLGATRPVLPAEARALRDHVERGGVLVVATDVGLSERGLLSALGVGASGDGPTGRVAVSHVALAAPPVRALWLDRSTRLDVSRGEGLVGGARPVVARVPLGRGAAYVVGSLDPFVNATIGEADNGRFVLALLGGATSVAFDEFHHGIRSAPNALGLLTATWPGVALLAAAGLTFLYLLLSGRRLGPPVPLDPRPARSSLEHVRGLAALLRRSGHREIVRTRLRDELRRTTSADTRDLDALLSRALPDAELLRAAERVAALGRRA